MRVLMFGWEFPPHISGGLGTACYGLTRSMTKAGCEIIFVVPRAYGDEDQRFIHIKNASDTEIYHGSIAEDQEFVKHLSFVHVNSNLVPYLTPQEYSTHRDEHTSETYRIETGDLWQQRYHFSGNYGENLMEEVARYAVVAGQIARELEGQFDVIHAHDWLTYYAGIAAKKISGKPLVIHTHATEFDRSGANVNQAVYDIERNGMHAADAICAVSNMTRQICIEKYGAPADRVVTVHNGVLFRTDKVTDFERGIDDKIVTFLGRITYQKGPDYFVEAAAKVLKRLPNVRFVMAGSGDMLNHVVRRVAKLGIADRFHFTGFLKGNDVQKMFSMSDLYVMPSVSEPFGISPLEAMRANVPVIISKQSGVAEVLENAVKIDYWDVDAMADAIYNIIKNPDISTAYKDRGLEEVNSLTWDPAAKQIIGIYDSLLNRK